MRKIVGVEVDLFTLRRAIGGSSWVKGKLAAAQGMVQDTSWNAAASELRGTVHGDRGCGCRVRAFFSIDAAGIARFTRSECDCEIRRDCKHVVALVHAALSSPADPAAPEPAGVAVPLAMELRLEDGLGWQRGLLARIVRRDRSGAWTDDRLTWGNLESRVSWLSTTRLICGWSVPFSGSTGRPAAAVSATSTGRSTFP